MKTSTRYSFGLTLSSGSEPETMTRPSWRRMASEWYRRATMVVFMIREARAHGLVRVVEEGVEIRYGGGAEAGDTCECAV